MDRVILDTNFILSCIKQKIDFFGELEQEGYQIIIPKQVINELKLLKSRDKKQSSYESKLALKLLKKYKFKKTDLKTNKADKAILKFAKKHPRVIIATLDKELKEKIKNKKLIIRGKNKLEIV